MTGKETSAALERIRARINGEYGFEGSTPRINYGPCGVFADIFNREWNARFPAPVRICFVMQPDGECWHVCLRLPDGSLYDGGAGIHGEDAYPGFRVEDMEVYDRALLEARAYGLDRTYPRFCPKFSRDFVEKVVSEELDSLPAGTNGAANTPELVTERLLLRRFAPRDLDDFLLLMSDRETNRFLPWFPLRTRAEAETFLRERFLAWYEKPWAFRYAVCLKTDGRPIGYVCLDDGPARDFGYGLRSDFQRRGIAAEAARAVLDAIRKSGVPFVTATHDVNNPASGAVMKKCGMTYRYSYVEQWQPKNFPVTFRMYQLNLDGNASRVWRGYWDKWENHFAEPGI